MEYKSVRMPMSFKHSKAIETYMHAIDELTFDGPHHDDADEECAY
jgi:hypothetical protein